MAKHWKVEYVEWEEIFPFGMKESMLERNRPVRDEQKYAHTLFKF